MKKGIKPSPGDVIEVLRTVGNASEEGRNDPKRDEHERKARKYSERVTSGSKVWWPAIVSSGPLKNGMCRTYTKSQKF